MIDIKGLDKAEVLIALWDNSHAQGMSFLSAIPEGAVTVEHFRELLQNKTYFDYLYGRVIKVDLSEDEFDERLYDRDNYPGAAAEAIAPLRHKIDPLPQSMTLIVGERQAGKTSKLIRMSAAGHGTIVALTEQSVKYIKTQAKAMNLSIPEPINLSTFLYNRRGTTGPYLLDELGWALKYLGVKVATLDDECAIEILPRRF